MKVRDLDVSKRFIPFFDLEKFEKMKDKEERVDERVKQDPSSFAARLSNVDGKGFVPRMKLQKAAARVSGSSKLTENKVTSRVSFTLPLNDLSLSSPSPSKLIGVVRSDSKKKVSFSPVDDVYEYDQEDPTPTTQVDIIAKEIIFGSNPIDEGSGPIPKANVEVQEQVQEQEGVQKSQDSAQVQIDMNNNFQHHVEGTKDSNSNIVTYARKIVSKVHDTVRDVVDAPKVNFRHLHSDVTVDGVDVVIPLDSVREVNHRFANTLYGYFLGKRLSYPVVEKFVKDSWSKYGMVRLMMNVKGFFFFKFNSKHGMENLLEDGPWMIRNVPIILNVWSPATSLTKEDIKTIPVWVKMHDVPIAAFSEDGISMLASKIGTPMMLDSYTSTMCADSWGRSSFARALVKMNADSELKRKLVVAVPDLDGAGYSKSDISIEYDWEPPRCGSCCVFGHSNDQCPKKPTHVPNQVHKVDDEGFQVVKGKDKKSANMKNQGFIVNKQKQKFEYRPVVKFGKQPKKDVGGSMPTITSSNKFDVLGHMGKYSFSGEESSSGRHDKGDESDNDLIEEVFSETCDFIKYGPLPDTSLAGASTPTHSGSHG